VPSNNCCLFCNFGIIALTPGHFDSSINFIPPNTNLGTQQ
jgi:hypothetical protein